MKQKLNKISKTHTHTQLITTFTGQSNVIGIKINLVKQGINSQKTT